MLALGGRGWFRSGIAVAADDNQGSTDIDDDYRDCPWGLTPEQGTAGAKQLLGL